MGREPQLAVELLEDRTAPATFGVAWPDAAHLTLSFARDGTSVVGQASTLFADLDAQLPTADWQQAILRAFQTWAVHGNINIGLVAEIGELLPFGTSGPIQGDSRFGDIRVGTYPLAADVIAVSSPFDVLASTWAGDVKLNTASYAFGPTGHDLFTVFLHEAGHVLGLSHSDAPDSPLFESYRGVRAGLTAADILRLQELYGPRRPDAFDDKKPNDTPDNAVVLSAASAAVDGDLTTFQDVDYYQFRVTGQATDVTVRLRTAGLSLLVPRLSVLDADGHVVATVAATSPLDGDLAVELTNLRPSQTYYLRVERATGDGDVFGIGSYRLEVATGAARDAAPQDLREVRVVADSGPADDLPQKAVNLVANSDRADARFDYSYWARLDHAGDVDYYRFRSPRADGETIPAMTLMVWATQPGSLHPRIQLFDHQSNLVPVEVLVNEDGSSIVQVVNVPANANYLLAVRAGPSGDPDAIGDYFLGIDFAPQAVQLQTIVNGHVLDAANPLDAGTLHVAQSQLFHLVLSAESAPGTAVGLTVFAPSGQAVFTTAVLAGDSRSATLYFTPGDYTFQVTAATAGTTPLPPVAYSLLGLGLSDPIGPHPADATASPAPAASVPTTSDGSAYWWQAGYYSFLALTNPPAEVKTSLSQPQLQAIQGLFSAGGSTVPSSPVFSVLPTTGSGLATSAALFGTRNLPASPSAVPALPPVGGVALPSTAARPLVPASSADGLLLRALLDAEGRGALLTGSPRSTGAAPGGYLASLPPSELAASFSPVGGSGRAAGFGTGTETSDGTTVKGDVSHLAVDRHTGEPDSVPAGAAFPGGIVRWLGPHSLSPGTLPEGSWPPVSATSPANAAPSSSPEAPPGAPPAGLDGFSVQLSLGVLLALTTIIYLCLIHATPADERTMLTD